MSTGVVSWSKTAASNANADANINFAEGMAASQVNDSCRALMASVAKYRDDCGGALFTGGSGTAYTITTNQVFTSLAEMDGQTITVRFHATNGASATLNADGLGAKSLTLFDISGAVPSGLLRANTTATLTYNNTNGVWIVQGQRPLSVVIQQFSSSGTYTPTTNMAYCIVECVGGGGGGGGAAGSATGFGSGGGGGGGGYAKIVLTAAQVGASQTVTIGAAGAAGTAGNNAGGSGGNTSLGTLCAAAGGSAGGGAAAGTSGSPGSGGGGTTGTLLLTGSAGGQGAAASITTVSLMSGLGGGAPMYSGITPGLTAFAGAQNGNTAFQSGAGGSGGSSQGSASNAAGGSGAKGLVVITEFVY